SPRARPGRPRTCPEIALGRGVALRGRAAVPLDGLGGVHGNSLAVVVLVADLKLGARIALLGRAQEDLRGGGVLARLVQAHALVEVRLTRLRRLRLVAGGQRLTCFLAAAVGREAI